MFKPIFLSLVLFSLFAVAKSEFDLYPMEKFTLFVNSNRGPKMLEVKIELELQDKSIAKSIALNRSIIRHDIRNLLGKYSQNGYWGTEEIDLLRSDIKASIEKKLKAQKIKKVHFTEFKYK